MLERALYVLGGVLVVPVLKTLIRPLVVEVLRGGIRLGREAGRLGAEAREGFVNLAEEAAEPAQGVRRKNRASR